MWAFGILVLSCETRAWVSSQKNGLNGGQVEFLQNSDEIVTVHQKKSSKPISWKTTFIKNHNPQKPLSSKTFSSKSTFINETLNFSPCPCTPNPKPPKPWPWTPAFRPSTDLRVEHRLRRKPAHFHRNTDYNFFAIPIVFGSVPTLNLICDENGFWGKWFWWPWMKLALIEKCLKSNPRWKKRNWPKCQTTPPGTPRLPDRPSPKPHNISLFLPFSHNPHQIPTFFPSGCLLLECWCFWKLGRSNVDVSGSRGPPCETHAAPPDQAVGLLQDDPENSQRAFWSDPRSKHFQKSTKKKLSR